MKILNFLFKNLDEEPVLTNVNEIEFDNGSTYRHHKYNNGKTVISYDFSGMKKKRNEMELNAKSQFEELFAGIL